MGMINTWHLYDISYTVFHIEQKKLFTFVLTISGIIYYTHVLAITFQSQLVTSSKNIEHTRAHRHTQTRKKSFNTNLYVNININIDLFTKSIRPYLCLNLIPGNFKYHLITF
jgi:hypothetical protein